MAQSNYNWPINPTTVNSGPLQYEVNGAPVTVNIDTGTPANSTPLPVTILDPAGLPIDYATEAKQDAQIVLETAGNASLSSIDGKVLTDTQLRATPVPVSGPLTDTQLRASPVPVSLASAPLPTGAATEAKQDDEIAELQDIVAKTSPLFVTDPFDEIDITYISGGNGDGEIGTVVYKQASATIATLTLTYDSSNRLTNVVRS